MWLQQNELDYIEIDSFSFNTNIKEFDLSRNKLKAIQNFHFKNLSKLEILSLAENEIENVETDSFDSLKSLVEKIFYGCFVISC